jgi:hypothetical protein
VPLETAFTINQLVASNPADTDSEGLSGAHLRLIKSTILNSFPNVNAAVTATPAILNLPTMNGSGNGLRFNGAVPCGAMFHFPADPGTTIVARGGTAAGTEQYIECDGSSYASSKFPDLAASPFVTVSGSNFSVPLLTDTGRFLRSRVPGTTTPGTAQANQFAAHTHANTLTDPGHTHTVTDPGHIHAITDPQHNHTYGTDNAGTGASPGEASAAASGVNNNNPSTSSSSTGITINSHTTGITNVSNTTGITLANVAAGTGTETRPEAFVAMCVLKT